MRETIESGRNLEEESFRLSQQEVGAWAESILCSGRGDVRDPDVLNAATIIERHLQPILEDELTRGLVDENRLGAVKQEMQERTITGLAELSEGLSHYGLVQAIVSVGGRDEVIDLAGIRADQSDMAILVDRQAREHRYENFISLLMPREDGDE